MSHNCVLCKVFACFHVFSEWIRRKNQTFHFREKCAFPRTLFFLENTAFIFGVKRRTNERSERNCVAKAGKAAAEIERSERKAEGGERSETTEPRASERSERAFTDQVKRPATRP